MTAAEAYERFLVPAILGPWAQVALSLSPPSSGAAVLDVACGTGIGARLAARIVGPSGRVAGLDSDEGMLEMVRAVAAGASGASVAWRHGNALALPFPDEAFDHVLCFEGIQFFPDREAGLRDSSARTASASPSANGGSRAAASETNARSPSERAWYPGFCSSAAQMVAIRRRKAMLTALLEAETHATLRKELGAGVGAAWEEYLCHEAGHGLGLDVGTKVALHFFRPGGRLAPPLLFGEERRADLLSLRFALRLLAPERARAVFAFHLLHRFGAHDRGAIRARRGSCAPALPPLLRTSEALRHRRFLGQDCAQDAPRKVA